MLKLSRNEKGFLMPTVFLVLAVLTVISVGIFTVASNAEIARLRTLHLTMSKSWIRSATETLLPALYIAQSKYMEMVTGCPTANTFSQALFSGHNCGSVGNLTVLESGDLDILDASERNLIQYFGDWSIRKTTVGSPASKGIAKVQIDPQVRIDFYLDTILPEKSLLLVTAIVNYGKYEILTRSIAISVNFQQYLLHLDSSNSEIIQEKQNPFNPCRAGDWVPFQNLSSGVCSTLGALGGATGIASYKDHYFGLRPTDGQIVHLDNLATADYLVDEAGMLGSGEKVFPAYKKNLMVGVEDIEVIGQDRNLPQIYYIGGFGNEVHIGYMDPANNITYHVCDLGALGWAQSAVGLSVSAGSDALIPKAGDTPSLLMASFKVKTDNGDILYVHVRSQKNIFKYNSGLPSEATITNATLGRTFVCVVQKQRSQPPQEYLRTLGITQEASVKKVFFIY